MLIKTFGFAEGSSPDLARPNLVRIELRIERGILFRISGMKGAVAKSAQARIRSALLSCGYKWPGKGITINSSPATESRNSSMYDLAIATCILAAEGKVPNNKIDKLVISGELGLDGAVYSRHGDSLTSATNGTISHKSIGKLFTSLKSVIAYLNSSRSNSSKKPSIQSNNRLTETRHFVETTFAQISGEPSAKRKAIIAAAGDHNIILIGPPGSGKSVLAKCIHSLLPKLNRDESIAVKKSTNEHHCPVPPQGFHGELLIIHQVQPDSLAHSSQRKALMTSSSANGASPNRASYSWTNGLNFPAPLSKLAAFQWKQAPSPWRGRQEASNYPRKPS